MGRSTENHFIQLKVNCGSVHFFAKFKSREGHRYVENHVRGKIIEGFYENRNSNQNPLQADHLQFP